MKLFARWMLLIVLLLAGSPVVWAHTSDTYTLSGSFSGSMSTAQSALSDCTECTLVIDAAATVSSNLTFGSGTTIVFESPGLITVNPGVTLDLSATRFSYYAGGPYNYIGRQVFSCSGTGKVQLPGEAVVTGEMWGAVGDGSTDDTTPLQAAFDSGSKHVQLLAKTYATSGLKYSEGQTVQGTGPQMQFSGSTDKVIYSGTILKMTAATGFVLRSKDPDGNSPPQATLFSPKFFDFTINMQRQGDWGLVLESVCFGQVKNVHVYNVPSGNFTYNDGSDYGDGIYPRAAIVIKGKTGNVLSVPGPNGDDVDNDSVAYCNEIAMCWVVGNVADDPRSYYGGSGILITSSGPFTSSRGNFNRVIGCKIKSMHNGIDVRNGSDTLIMQPDVSLCDWGIAIGKRTSRTVVSQIYAEGMTYAPVLNLGTFSNIGPFCSTMQDGESAGTVVISPIASNVASGTVSGDIAQPPRYPHTVTVVYPSGWDALPSNGYPTNVITVNGTDSCGTAISETFDIKRYATSGTIRGAKLFATVTSVTKGAQGTSSAAATVKYADHGRELQVSNVTGSFQEGVYSLTDGAFQLGETLVFYLSSDSYLFTGRLIGTGTNANGAVSVMQVTELSGTPGSLLDPVNKNAYLDMTVKGLSSGATATIAATQNLYVGTLSSIVSSPYLDYRGDLGIRMTRNYLENVKGITNKISAYDNFYMDFMTTDSAANAWQLRTSNDTTHAPIPRITVNGHAAKATINIPSGAAEIQLNDNDFKMGATNKLNGDLLQMNANACIKFGTVLYCSGSGSPEGVLAAPVGSIWTRTDGSTSTTLYVKQTGGTTNTGWTAK